MLREEELEAKWLSENDLLGGHEAYFKHMQWAYRRALDDFIGGLPLEKDWHRGPYGDGLEVAIELAEDMRDGKV